MSHILVDGQSIPKDCIRYIEGQLCPEKGWNISKAIAYLVEVGAAVMTNPDMKPLFETGILPVDKGTKDIPPRSRDPDAFFDHTAASSWSFDNSIINAMISNVIKSKFTYLSPFVVRKIGSAVATKDEEFRFFYDASEQYNNFIFSYTIATRDTQLSDASVETMKKCLVHLRKSMSRYVGHLFLNCTEKQNPECLPDFHVENVIPGDKAGLLVYLRSKDILKDPVLAQDYIADAIKALSLVSKGGLRPRA